MRTWAGVFLVTFFLIPCSSFAEGGSTFPERSAAVYLEKTMGEDAVDILHERGYLLVSDHRKAGRRVLYANFGSLRSLADNASVLQSFLRLYERQRRRPEGQGELKDVRAVQNLQAAGLVTPAVKAAADVLALHAEAVRALGGVYGEVRKRKLLHETRWGERFVERVHGDVLTDFASVADDFFDSYLKGPVPPEPGRHFVEHVRAAYGKDISKLLEADRTSGKLSKRLSGWVERYLLDQKHLCTISMTRKRLRDIEGDSRLRRDAKELRVVTAGFLTAPDILEKLYSILHEATPKTRIVFSGPDLHVRTQDGGEHFNVGDELTVSIAYWVEGLSPGEKARVLEAGFLDRGKLGVSQRTIFTHKRRNGGPFTFTAKVRITSREPAVYRFFIGSPGSETFRRTVEIGPNERLHEARFAAGHADSLVAKCLFDEAGKAFQSLRTRLAPIPRSGFRRLLAETAGRSLYIEGSRGRLERLETGVEAARLFASKEQCSFDMKRAERALETLRLLPPGCGLRSGDEGRRFYAELPRLQRAAQRRMLNQQAFRIKAEEARDLESACRFQDAARAYAGAMALLDSDPAARCGAWEEEYTRIRLQELPRTLSASDLREAIGRSIGRARGRFSAGDYQGSLRILTPLAAGLRSMREGRCYRSQMEAAEQLAVSAGVALGSPDAKRLKAMLPEDSVSEALASVEKGYQRYKKLEDQRIRREDLRQAPITPKGGRR